MNVLGNDDHHHPHRKKTMFSPKASPLGVSPGLSPKLSPVGMSPGFTPKPAPLAKSPAFPPKLSPLRTSPVRPKKQEKPESPPNCCGSCLGKRSPARPPPPAQTPRQTIRDQQLADQERDNRRVTFIEKVIQGYISPRVPSPALLRTSPSLADITSQARINGWQIDPEEIELHEQVGRGSTADIYRGTWKGLDVAVKCITSDFFNYNESGVTFFVQEIETLSKQRHPFVLRLVGACLNPPLYGWVVTEFLSTTLKEWLHGMGNRRTTRLIPLPPFKDRIGKAVEIAQAMQYLHDQKPKLIHRDLKPSNVFMDDAMHVRVADFGHARYLSEGEQALTGETGTYVYMAPEVIRCEPYNETCDVFSYGVILNELITGQHPYIETDFGPTEIALGVAHGTLRPALPEDDGQLGEIIDLICHTWNEDASIRPSFAVIACTLKRIQERLTTED